MEEHKAPRVLLGLAPDLGVTAARTAGEVHRGDDAQLLQGVEGGLQPVDVGRLRPGGLLLQPRPPQRSDDPLRLLHRQSLVVEDLDQGLGYLVRLLEAAPDQFAGPLLGVPQYLVGKGALYGLLVHTRIQAPASFNGRGVPPGATVPRWPLSSSPR